MEDEVIEQAIEPEIPNEENTDESSAQVENETVEDATTSVDEQEQEDKHEEERKSNVQKRIDKLTKARYEEKRRADLAEEKLQALQKNEPSGSESAGKPSVDQYEDYDEYIEALVDWKADARSGHSKRTQELRTRADSEADRELTLNATAESLITAGEAKYNDFKEVAGSAPISDDVIIALGDSPLAADIAYYLGHNPQIAQQITSLSPVRLGRAIVEIEQELSASAQQRVKPSNAPAPITPIGARGKTTKAPQDMSDSEFDEWRAKYRNNRR